jgi:hypothetical protein
MGQKGDDFDDDGGKAFDKHFGWCPECGRSDGYVNIGRSHVFYCDAHRTRWSAGSNLFSSWRYEDEATWARNAEHVGPYREVDSHTPTPAMLEALHALKG